MDSIQHRVTVVAGEANIDVEVELIFNEFRSLAERRRMDGDADGRISAAERGEYAAEVGRALADAIGITLDGHDLDVMPLYTPEVDLLGVEHVAPCRHVLRLFYFARTPRRLREASELVVVDRLWPTAPAITSLTAVGEDGIQLAAVAGGPLSRADEAGRPRLLKARCQRVPAGWVNAEAPVLETAADGGESSTHGFSGPGHAGSASEGCCGAPVSNQWSHGWKTCAGCSGRHAKQDGEGVSASILPAVPEAALPFPSITLIGAGLLAGVAGILWYARRERVQESKP